jgi:hypothetical protein
MKHLFYALLIGIPLHLEAAAEKLSPVVQALIAKYCPEGRKTGCKEPRLQNGDERVVAFRRRVLVAERETILRSSNSIENEGNGDEQTVPLFAANFSKTLEHDATTGLLTASGVENYKRLLQALRTGSQADFNAIMRAPGAMLKLVNPQGSFTFSLEGSDSSLFRLDPFPHLSSPEFAAFMIEDYLMALARDVNFEDYGTGQRTDRDAQGNSITNQAAAVLNDLGSAFEGPRNAQGQVDASVLFRGSFLGSLIGPYVSQYLLVPLLAPLALATGSAFLNPKPLTTLQLRPIARMREFGVSFTDFVAIQNGRIPKLYNVNDYDQVNTRYIITGRDLGSFVHYDNPYEATYIALNILTSREFPISPVLPYRNGTIKNEAPFVTQGVADVYGLIGGVMLEGLKAAWAQKWRAHRTLRPEAFAGLVHRAKVTGENPFNLNSSIFEKHAGIDVLDLILKKNQQQASSLIDPTHSLTVQQASTYLLAQMYPEGCPPHPSYPAGHAVIAGACATVIKAIFDDTVKLITKFKPVKVDPADPTNLIPLQGEGEDQMTVGSELDKLASNMALSRNFAGVHWRNDGEDGILLGEEVGIRYLQDHGCLYTEETFTGFELTKRDGTRIKITPDAVIVLGHS